MQVVITIVYSRPILLWIFFASKTIHKQTKFIFSILTVWDWEKIKENCLLKNILNTKNIWWIKFPVLMNERLFWNKMQISFINKTVNIKFFVSKVNHFCQDFVFFSWSIRSITKHCFTIFYLHTWSYFQSLSFIAKMNLWF